MRTSIIIIISILVTLPFFSTAQTITWTGDGHNNDWSDPDNWNPQGIPDASDRVLIENDSVFIVGINPEIAYLELNSAQLLIQGFLLVDNSDTFAIRANESVIYNQHVIEIDNAGNQVLADHAIELFNSSLYNDSTIWILNSEGGGIYTKKSEICNQGIIEMESVNGRGFFWRILPDY